MAIAAFCFLVVLAAIGWGIYEVYQIGHPAAKYGGVRTSSQTLTLACGPHREALRTWRCHPFLNAIIQWLRAGYPEGVPDVDYIPLFALLGSQLTDTEVSAIADRAGTTRATRSRRRRSARPSRPSPHEQPLDADVARVRARLAARGLAAGQAASPVSATPGGCRLKPAAGGR